MRWRLSLLVAGILLAGCSLSVPDPPDRRVTTPPAPRYDVPVAMVTRHGAGLDDLSLVRARALIDDGIAPPGLRPVTAGVAGVAASVAVAPTPADAVAAVAKDPSAMAIVPATAVTPAVRAVTVAGLDPVRDAASYPLQTTTPVAPGAVLVTSIVGDIMLGRRVGTALQRQGDPAAVLKPFAKRLAAADITVGNLESTLSRNGPPSQGDDSFAAAPEVLAGLNEAGFDVLSIGNNHLGDYGQRAIAETVDRLTGAGFAITGGGKDLDQARRPAVLEREGVRIGFIATDSIGETPAATNERAGSNRINAPPRTGPLDQRALARVCADIRALDARTNLVIVIPHWGTQYTHTPEQSQRQLARAFVEAGADLVVGGHPHWVQGWEQIGEATVIHSLGNFIFDMDFMRKTNEGIFVEAVSWGDRIVAIEPVPYVIDAAFTPRPASAGRAAAILDDIGDSSRPPFERLRQ